MAFGIPWALTDSRDAAYRAQGQYLNYNNQLQTTMPQVGPHASSDQLQQGFNLKQWFIDQGVTDTSKQTFGNYLYDRGLPQTPASLVWMARLPENAQNAIPGQNAWNYSGSGLDNFSMKAQNMATDLNIDTNAAIKPGAVVNYDTNNSNRPKLQASGGPSSNGNPLATPLNLATPTLLSGM